MKVTTLLIVLSLWFLWIRVSSANYRRIIRGPPQPPRPPPGPVHYHKKWHMPPPRSQVRPRPIPIHMGPTFKMPVGPPISARFGSPNKRNSWKNAPLKPSSEKPFFSSPTISVPEYDYHIQTNSIPNHINTVKQVDEKGPIHTIPAPNLSPADKPTGIENVKSVRQEYQPVFNVHHHVTQQASPQQSSPLQSERTIVEVQKSHQYQVTESSDSTHASQNAQLYFTDSIQSSDVKPDHPNALPHAEYLMAPQEGFPGTHMTPQDLYNIFNMYPQKQFVDVYGIAALQQQNSPTRALPSYQTSQLNTQSTNVNTGHFPPRMQFQTFNYDERENNNNQKVTADFKVKSDYDTNEGNGIDALAQAHYVQHFFDTNGGDEDNDVEPDARSNPTDGVTFFSSLPNKEAAKALVSLQEAGKLKNKEVEMGNKMPLTIYVPDNYDSSQRGDGRDRAADNDGGNYEDESEGDDDADDRNMPYGNKLRSK